MKKLILLYGMLISIHSWAEEVPDELHLICENDIGELTEVHITPQFKNKSYFRIPMSFNRKVYPKAELTVIRFKFEENYITGRFAFDYLRKSTFEINRKTGVITYDGYPQRREDDYFKRETPYFEGVCEKYDLDSIEKKF